MGFGSDNSKCTAPVGALLTSGGDSFSTLQTQTLSFEGLKHRKANCSMSASTKDHPPIWGDSGSDNSAPKCSLQDQLDATQLKKAPAAKGEPKRPASARLPLCSHCRGYADLCEREHRSPCTLSPLKTASPPSSPDGNLLRCPHW